MKLYMVPAAPNPTKVMLYIAERKAMGVDLGVEQIVVNTLKGKHKEPEHLARNPFGTLPVLELESGECLVESLSIILYLETIQSDNALLSGSEIEKALARDLERTIELRLANSVGAYVHAVNSPFGLTPDQELGEKLKTGMDPALGYLEILLRDGRQMLTGDRVSLADLTLQSALQFARFGKVDILESYGEIAAWDLRYREREAAKEVLKF